MGTWHSSHRGNSSKKNKAAEDMSCTEAFWGKERKPKPRKHSRQMFWQSAHPSLSALCFSSALFDIQLLYLSQTDAETTFLAPDLNNKHCYKFRIMLSYWVTKQLDCPTCQIAEMINTTLGSISNQCKDTTCVCCQRVNACSVTWFHHSLLICVQHGPYESKTMWPVTIRSTPKATNKSRS